LIFTIVGIRQMFGVLVVTSGYVYPIAFNGPVTSSGMRIVNLLTQLFQPHPLPWTVWG